MSRNATPARPRLLPALRQWFSGSGTDRANTAEAATNAQAMVRAAMVNEAIPENWRRQFGPQKGRNLFFIA